MVEREVGVKSSLTTRWMKLLLPVSKIQPIQKCKKIGISQYDIEKENEFTTNAKKLRTIPDCRNPLVRILTRVKDSLELFAIVNDV